LSINSFDYTELEVSSRASFSSQYWNTTHSLSEIDVPLEIQHSMLQGLVMLYIRSSHLYELNTTTCYLQAMERSTGSERWWRLTLSAMVSK